MSRLGRGGAAALLGLMAVSCAKDQEPAREDRILTIWWAQWAPADGLQQLGFRFEQETGIQVRVHQILAAAQQYLGEALDGVRPAKEAVDRMAREHQRILGEAGRGG